MVYREWLLANGLGAYGIGTSIGTVFRSYHALLTLPLRPPLQRRKIVRQVFDELFGEDSWLALTLGLRRNGFLQQDSKPIGVEFIYENHLPVYNYSYGRCFFSKRLWMEHHVNALYVQYRVEEKSQPVRLRLQPCMMVDKDFAKSQPLEATVRLTPSGYAFNSEISDQKWLYFTTDKPANVVGVNNWHRVHYEGADGVAEAIDYVPAAFEIALRAGESVTLRIGLDEIAYFDADLLYREELRRQDELIERLPACLRDDPRAQQMTIAADRFAIERPTAISRQSSSLLTAYPDHLDDGWSALIALPGLLLIANRYDRARMVFNMLRRHANDGQIPFHFSDKPAPPDYSSIDSTLWFFIAVYEYWQTTNDSVFIEELYSFLLQLLNAFIRGTANGVHMDPEDGLLENRKESLARTWMNHKFENWEATPRIGKAVEIQALWYNVLRIMHEISGFLKKDTGEKRSADLAEQVCRSIQQKFWLPEQKLIADCVVGETTDTTCRANQIIALGLPYTPFTEEHTRSALELAKDQLVTPYGLRTLSNRHPAYRGHVGTTEQEHVGAWHNGIIHPWLTWPYVRAALRAGYDAVALYAQFEPLFAVVESVTLGNINEAYEGEPPFSPIGKPASAVSLGAVFQSYAMLRSLR